MLVVKAPTSIVKAQVAAPSARAADAALHAGVGVDKAVVAATVVTFASSSAALPELDREGIDAVAKLAAKERCELLVWARAKDPSLMGEAQRRAAEIKARAVASGPLDEKQVVTRITTRPSAERVDVLVSALRDPTRPAAAAAARPAPSRTLESGEGGKRQIRAGVIAAQGSIEACVGEHIEARDLRRAEGVLTLTISSEGRVEKISTRRGDLSGEDLDACLGGASRTWTFPPADAGYVVDVPITAVGGGAAR